jgi:hypothetical protein
MSGNHVPPPSWVCQTPPIGRSGQNSVALDRMDSETFDTTADVLRSDRTPVLEQDHAVDIHSYIVPSNTVDNLLADVTSARWRLCPVCVIENVELG